MRTYCQVLLLLSTCVFLFIPSMAIGESTCFTCHESGLFAGKVTHLPVKEDNCIACHSPHVSKFPKMLQYDSGTLCRTCHESTQKEYTVTHTPFAKGNCLICHAPHKSTRPNLVYDDLREKCFSCHKLTDKKYTREHQPFAAGDCYSCHQVHGSDNFSLLNEKDGELCLRCHKKSDLTSQHRNKTSAEMTINMDLAFTKCLSCHSPHGSNKGHLLREIIHKPLEKGCAPCHQGKNALSSNDLCYSCHPAIKKDINQNFSHIAGDKINRCISCHSPHGGNDKSLMKGIAKEICLKCHQDTVNLFKDKLYKHPVASFCTECHDVHGSENIGMLRGDGKEVCVRCHATQGKFSHPLGWDTLDPRTGQAMTCIHCHTPMGTDFTYNLKLSSKRELCVQCHPY